MKEIQGKSILVQISMRFKLARVWVISSQLYVCNLGEMVNPTWASYGEVNCSSTQAATQLLVGDFFQFCYKP